MRYWAISFDKPVRIDSHNLHQTQTGKTDRKKDMKKSFPKKKFYKIPLFETAPQKIIYQHCSLFPDTLHCFSE